MLLYVAQLALQVATSARRPRVDLLGEVRHARRVWPFDLDSNVHMNNGRYLTLMDFGRVDLIVRTGLGEAMLKRRWHFVVASQTIRYRRPLAPMERYDLVTRLVCWDATRVYIEHRFEAGNALVSQGFVVGAIRGRGGTVPVSEALAELGRDQESPPMPEHLAEWRRSEERLKKVPS